MTVSSADRAIFHVLMDLLSAFDPVPEDRWTERQEAMARLRAVKAGGWEAFARSVVQEDSNGAPEGATGFFPFRPQDAPTAEVMTPAASAELWWPPGMFGIGSPLAFPRLPITNVAAVKTPTPDEIQRDLEKAKAINEQSGFKWDHRLRTYVKDGPERSTMADRKVPRAYPDKLSNAYPPAAEARTDRMYDTVKNSKGERI